MKRNRGTKGRVREKKKGTEDRKKEKKVRQSTFPSLPHLNKQRETGGWRDGAG